MLEPGRCISPRSLPERGFRCYMIACRTTRCLTQKGDLASSVFLHFQRCCHIIDSDVHRGYSPLLACAADAAAASACSRAGLSNFEDKDWLALPDRAGAG